MEVRIKHSQINGKLTANPSKSSMQRAIAVSLLANGTSLIQNSSQSNDCKAALKIAEQLGATILQKDNQIEITSSQLVASTNTINCGESGLAIRMFTPIISLLSQEFTITGSGSLLKRPIGFLEEILPQLEVKCKTNQGFLPITVEGPLIPANISITASDSSQYLTGLLISYGMFSKNIQIDVKNLNSKPYIDLTLDVMKQFGVDVQNNNYQSFKFSGKSAYRATSYTVEGDWSGAAFLLVAAAISGKISVKGINLKSTQADKSIVAVLKQVGADVIEKENEISVAKNNLNAFEFDATHCPDLFPPLVALATHCNGKSIIKGTNRLIYKESNRAETLKKEFAKMGIVIQIQKNEMHVFGRTNTLAATLNSNNDHRIAMACAVAALKCEEEIKITHAEAIHKSYPNFFEHLRQIGAKIQLNA